MQAVAPHARERVLEVAGPLRGAEVPDARAGDGQARGGPVDEVEHVLEVHVADGSALGVLDGVAGEAALLHGPLHVGRGRPRRQAHQLLEPDLDVAHLGLGELEGVRSVPDRSASTPSRVDCSTMPATSSRVNALAASSFGSTPKSRTAALARPFSAQMIGRRTRETMTSGGASSSAARVGTENDRFLGTISPSTTCRNVTSSSATTNDTRPTVSLGQPGRAERSSNRWWIAGSETLRMSSEQMVMPSCEVASISVACSIAHSVVRAARLPPSASGSTCERRAVTTANSAPTKKAFAASSTTSQTRPGTTSLIAPPFRRLSVSACCSAACCSARSWRRSWRVWRRSVSATCSSSSSGSGSAGVNRTRSTRLPSSRSTRSVPASTSTSSPDLGEPVEPVGDEAADGLVLLVLGHPYAGPVEQLVGTQARVEGERVALAHQVDPGPVVLVGQLADQLLDEVLQRDQPGRAAVLVDHDGQLEALVRAAGPSSVSVVIDSGTRGGSTARDAACTR